MKVVFAPFVKSVPLGARIWEILKAFDDYVKILLWRQRYKINGVKIHRRIDFKGLWASSQRVLFSEGVLIERDVSIWMSSDDGADAYLKVGEKSFVGRNSFLGSFQPINIGSRVLIGAYCYIISANHRYERRDIPIVEQGFTGSPIVIEDDAWLGTHVVVLPGVTIGRGAIIAAGSVVTQNIPPWEIWGGVPVKFIKHRPE